MGMTITARQVCAQAACGRSKVSPVATARRALLAAALLGLAGCALDPIEDKSVAKQTAGAVGFSTPAPEPAPFVRESRQPGGTQYLPVGVTPPPREIAPSSQDRVKAIEAEMDARRNASAATARSARPSGSFDDLKPPKVPPPPAELVAQ